MERPKLPENLNLLPETDQLRLYAEHVNSVDLYIGELEKAVRIDGLTQLYRKEWLIQALDEEFDKIGGVGNRRALENISLGLIYCDLDHFKRYNDTYGHPEGDILLRHVGLKILGSIRKYDRAFRNGGEEFAILSPATSLKDTVTVAERIKRSIAGISSKGTTMSFGVAVYPYASISTPTELMEYADQALYKAKETGRNKVVTVDELF